MVSFMGKIRFKPACLMDSQIGYNQREKAHVCLRQCSNKEPCARCLCVCLFVQDEHVASLHGYNNADPLSGLEYDLPTFSLLILNFISVNI